MNRGASKTKQMGWRSRRAVRRPAAPTTPIRPEQAGLRRVVPLALILAAASVSLGGCGNVLEKISEVGKPPAFTPIENPVAQASYQPVTMPMPAPMTDIRQPNSLWRQGSRTFFADQRASKVGDILTVVIQIDDSAKLANKTVQSRDGSNNAAASSLLGYQKFANQIFTDGIKPPSLIDTDSTSDQTGTGTVDRSEAVDLRVAAVITQVLPNGNLVLRGTQQVRVNFELRELDVDGIVRPEDISTGNEVSYDQIAEARIAYGGRGTLTDVQQPRYGQQVYDILFPF